MDRGISRVEKELEIDRFLKSQIKIKVALKVLFSKVERFLIKNNRKFVICSDESSDANSHDTKVERASKYELQGKNFDELLRLTGIPNNDK